MKCYPKTYKRKTKPINMGTVALKIKIMPEGIDTNLETLKQKAKKEIESLGGVLNNFEEEPIAFGLKALIATMAWPEEKDTEIPVEIFKKQPGVSSVDIIDYRRAFG